MRDHLTRRLSFSVSALFDRMRARNYDDSPAEKRLTISKERRI